MTTSIPDLGDAIRAFFAPDGPLARTFSSYEERAEQVTLALAVARALRAGTSLLAEAGTGTGKTLAYLIPALSSGLKVVVSTGTKALQEQLLTQDLPRLQGASGRSFDVVVLKGRRNYLCEARFEQVVAQRVLPGLMPDRELEAVRAWRERTESGDRSELATLSDDAPLWGELTVSSEQCLGRRCAQYDRCWVTKMRQRAQEAELVVVNHHLYFADAALRRRLTRTGGETSVGIIPPHDVVIFDEAHEIEEVASQYFGLQVSEPRVRDLCRDIAKSAGPDLGSVHHGLTELELRTTRLFDRLPFNGTRTRFAPGAIDEATLGRYQDLDATLQDLEAVLHTWTSEEAHALRRRAAQLGAELAFLLGQGGRGSTSLEAELPWSGDDNAADADASPANQHALPFVRFTETSARTRSLCARPLEIGPLMREALGTVPAICTSATLAVDRSFVHVRDGLGIAAAEELIADSPFDYAQQARLYLPADLPDVNDPEFIRAATERLVKLITASEGGAFVLCTSNRMVDALAQRLRQATPLRVLTQGSAPRSHLVERFREDGDAVLVATLSFWRGIDVPGRALRLVAIDRLPFAVPSDPVVEARMRHCEQRGRSAFNSYQLPQAILMLRQGFGRLIRSRTDRGMVAILDRRIVTRPYGRVILRSLPACPRLTGVDEACDYAAEVAHLPH